MLQSYEKSEINSRKRKEKDDKHDNGGRTLHETLHPTGPVWRGWGGAESYGGSRGGVAGANHW
jgi:hypothetical protein